MTSLILPQSSQAPFRIGTSVTVGSRAMDMSLNDLIDARKTLIAQQKRKDTSKNNQKVISKKKARTGLKSKTIKSTSTAKRQKISEMQKRIGASKSKRKVLTATRRGISSSFISLSKSSPKEVKRGIHRQQRLSVVGVRNKRNVIHSKFQIRNKNEPRLFKEKVNKKYLSKKSIKTPTKKFVIFPRKRKQNKSNDSAKISIRDIKAPTKKVVNAAFNAMKKAGFPIPPGMKMLVTLTPSKIDSNNKSKRASKKGQRRNDKRK